MALIGDNCEEILLKNQQVYVDERGRIGLVPTVLSKISDRCGTIPLTGKVVSYFSAREQDYVNIGQYPLDGGHCVSPSEIICLSQAESRHEHDDIPEQHQMTSNLAIKGQGSLDEKISSPRINRNGQYVLDYEKISENESNAEEESPVRISLKDCRSSFRKSAGRINIRCSVPQAPKDNISVPNEENLITEH